MKLARKITFALVLLAFVVIAGLEAVEVRRELERSTVDMEHDHRLLGHSLGGSIAQAWALAGEAEALTLLSEANHFQEQVRLRWVWLDGGPGPVATVPPGVPTELLPALRAGQDVSQVDSRARPGVMRSYTPVFIGERMGAIEISESLGEQRQHLRNTVLGLAVATATIAAIFLLAAMALGRRLVGRPVEQLVQLARRIGEGHLDARVELHQKDELDTLAREMNRMGEMLQKAHQDIAAETAARLAAQEHLRHADRLSTVGKLASGVAHELGTPLNVVLGHAKMISSGEVEGPESHDSARIIQQQAQHMTAIIRQLLDFARRSPPKRAPEDVGQLVARTLALLKPLASKRGVALVSEVSEGLTLEVDGGQLQQVLTNLVMNGLHAMKRPGSLRVRTARVRATPPADVGGAEAEWVRLDVEDEGEGIPPDVLPHVFEPFYTTKDVGEGTGLGLSVSYGLVRDHGGWIDVRTEPGRGSCFSIYLPPEEAGCQAVS